MDDRRLSGLVVRSFSIDTVFALEGPDDLNDLLKRRPGLLGASIQRPSGGPALEGMGMGEHVRFLLSWPGKAPLSLHSPSVYEPER